MNKIIIQFEQPGRNDKEPLDTICYLIVDDNTQQIYTQISADVDNPFWLLQQTIHD